jgi:hypothetical protein
MFHRRPSVHSSLAFTVTVTVAPFTSSPLPLSRHHRCPFHAITVAPFHVTIIAPFHRHPSRSRETLSPILIPAPLPPRRLRVLSHLNTPVTDQKPPCPPAPPPSLASSTPSTFTFTLFPPHLLDLASTLVTIVSLREDLGRVAVCRAVPA